MKIPAGKTQQEILDLIDKILKRYLKKMKFGIYDREDIYQEGFLIACDGLEKYDGVSPLENFLAIHIKNRLITFKRDNFGRPNENCNNCAEFDENCASCQKRRKTCRARRNLNQPIDILSINPESERAFKESFSSLDNVELDELIKLINKYLPIRLRENYLKMREGIYINKSIRDEIETQILNIIETYG